MGVFDKIKSLFIVEEDAGQNQNPLDAVTTEKAITTQPKVETPTIQTPKPTQVNSSGTITDKFTDVLMKALSDNNIEEITNINENIIKCNKCNKTNEKNNYIVICKLCKECRNKNKDYKIKYNKKNKGEEIINTEEIPKKKKIKKENENIIKIDIKKLMVILTKFNIEQKEFLNELLL